MCTCFLIFVAKEGEHTGFLVIEEVAMEGPNAWIVSIKLNDNSGVGCYKDGISEGSVYWLFIDVGDLKDMTVQMHRMAH